MPRKSKQRGADGPRGRNRRGGSSAGRPSYARLDLLSLEDDTVVGVSALQATRLHGCPQVPVEFAMDNLLKPVTASLCVSALQTALTR